MRRDAEEENKTIRSKYAKTLKEKYHSGIPTFLTLQWPPPPTLKVFNLAMISLRELTYGADDELVRLLLKGNVSDVVRQRNAVTLEQISDNLHSKGRKVILIEGAPGAGKTTLAWHLCKMWEAGKLFQEFEIVLFVQLCEPATQSARTLEDLFPAESLNKKKEAISAIRYCGGHQVLIVLDSWHEFPPGLDRDSIISELICNPSKLNMQFSALVITSRPIATGQLQRYTSTRIEIAGFVQSEVKRYFTEAIKEPQMVQKLIDQLKERPIIESSCYLPLNTVIIAHIFLAQNHTLPTTLHGVFTSLVLCCIIRHMEKQGRRSRFSSLDHLPLDIQEPFNNLCTLAYHGVRKNKATFSEEDLQLFNLPTELTTLSLMQGVVSFSTFGESRLYNFLHLSTQELLAAFYISKMQPEEQIKIFNALFEQPRFANIFKFYAAFTKFQNKGIRDTISRIVKSGNKTLMLSLFHCLYEAQDDELCHFIASQMNAELDLTNHSLSSVDCLSVGYFLSRVRSTTIGEFKLKLTCDQDTVSRVVKSNNKTLLLSLFHCLYEAQNDTLCRFIASQLKEELDLTYHSLNPVDCLSVGYFLCSVCSTTAGEFKLKLMFDRNDEYGASLLVRELSKHSIPSDTQPETAMKTGVLDLRLKLSGKRRTDKSLALKLICSSTMISKLNLSENAIGDTEIAALADTQTANHNLKVLK